MEHKFLTWVLRHLHLKETWVIFFILGIIMMNYPFIHIFDTPIPDFRHADPFYLSFCRLADLHWRHLSLR